jgi:hypothetical protein
MYLCQSLVIIRTLLAIFLILWTVILTAFTIASAAFVVIISELITHLVMHIK